MRFSPALGVALALPIVAVVELSGAYRATRSAPRIDDFAAAKGPIASERRAGDVVVVAPAWAEPNARAALGDDVFPLRDLARPDDSRARRLLVVGPPGAAPSYPDFRVAAVRALGPRLELQVLENQHPVTVATDLVDEIAAGRAAVSYPTGTCAFSENEPVITEGLFGPPAFPRARFVCGKEPWEHVGATVQEDERWRPRRCIWAHPTTGGDVVLRFPDVALAPTVHGHLGLHWTLERESTGAPIDLEVRVRDQPVGTVRHLDGEGWKPFTMPTGARAGERGAVEVRVRTADAGARHLCFEADLRGETP